MADGQPVTEPEVTDGTPEGEGVEPGSGEQTPEPQKLFVGGRYRTAEEIAEAYEASSREALRLKAQLDERERFMAPPNKAEPQTPSWVAQAQADGLSPQTLEGMVSWLGDTIEQRSDQKAAERVAELVEGIAKVSTAEGQAHAALAGEFEGYSKEKVAEYLASNSKAKARYDRVAQADIEAATRIAWLEYSGGAKVNGQPRQTQVPQSKRVPTKPAEDADWAKIQEAARAGEDWAQAKIFERLLKGQR